MAPPMLHLAFSPVHLIAAWTHVCARTLPPVPMSYHLGDALVDVFLRRFAPS